MERIDKIISGSGLYSRSQIKTLIAQGQVTADGRVVRSADMKISRDSIVTVCGETIDTAQFVYYMMNKPADYVSANKDELYPAVTRLLPKELAGRGLQPVGRLDADVTGLLILTDDGQFAHKLMSPKSETEKTYDITADAPMKAEFADLLAAGATLRDGTQYKPARLWIDADDPCHCRVTVTEGKFHEVKNLLAVCGRHVVSMCRISVGALGLDPSLAPGQGRLLTPEERNSCLA